MYLWNTKDGSCYILYEPNNIHILENTFSPSYTAFLNSPGYAGINYMNQGGLKCKQILLP